MVNTSVNSILPIYSIGQVVWLLKDREVIQVVIDSIIREDDVIYYSSQDAEIGREEVEEQYIFASREDLIVSLN